LPACKRGLLDAISHYGDGDGGIVARAPRPEGSLGAVAEFERDLIRSRVKTGLERARKRGIKIGRHRIALKIEAAIRERLQTGQRILKTAKELGLGTGTVHRVRWEMDGKISNVR
jgi:DNA invertase Pin-like site-specific DNA recombinase